MRFPDELVFINCNYGLLQPSESHFEAGLTSGIVFAAPIPQADEIDPKSIETAIQDALKEAEYFNEISKRF
jgi:pseudouridine-5'-phosphate glycosidase